MSSVTTEYDSDEPARLEVLLKSYELDRMDAAQALSSMYSLLTAAVGLLSLVGFVLLHAKDQHLPGWLVALAPLAPLPFISFGALSSVSASARVRLSVMYEEELRRRHATFVSDPDRRIAHRAPSAQALVAQASQTYAGTFVTMIALATLLTIYGAIVIESFQIARHTSPTLAWAVLIVCLVGTVGNVGVYVWGRGDAWLKRRVDALIEREGAERER